MTLELCAREAAQILGGCSYTRGGQGDKVIILTVSNFRLCVYLVSVAMTLWTRLSFRSLPIPYYGVLLCVYLVSVVFMCYLCSRVRSKDCTAKYAPFLFRAVPKVAFLAPCVSCSCIHGLVLLVSCRDYA